MSWPFLECKEGERTFVRDCLVIHFFLDRSHAAMRPALLHAIEMIIQFVGSSSIKWYLDEEGEPQPFDQDEWSRLRDERFSPDASEGGLRLLGSEDDIASFYFKYWGWELPRSKLPGWRNLLQIRLPREFVQGRVQEAAAFAQQLGASLPFSSGYVSSALALLSRQRVYWGRGLRYPGIDLLNPETACTEIAEHIPGVYWLTFLGPCSLEALGGIAALGSQLPMGVTLSPMQGHGAVLQIGAEPQSGDINRGDNLPLYRAVARVLAPQLYFATRAHLLSEGTNPDLDATLNWQQRFLD